MLIDRLHYALGLDTSEFKHGWANADNLMGTMDAKMKSLATGAGIAGLAMALGKIGIAAVNMARELGSAMNEVWSIMDKNKDEMQDISAEILNLSRSIPESAPALAKAYYQVISAGITDASEAMNVLAVSSKTATAGLTSTFTTVDAITNVLNAYNIEASEAQEISDDFFISVRDGKMTMEQLAPAIGQVVGTAALAKVELKEVLAAMVSMTLAGYSVDEAATSMNRLLLSIVNTQDDAKEAAKSVGIEWSVAGLKAKGFQGFIKDLNDKAGDNIELLQAIVPEIRAFRAAAVIAGTGADNYARSLNNLKNSAGATDQALSKIMSGTGKQWQLVKNQLNASMIELGQRILPAVKTAVEFVADGFEALGLTGETEARRLQREWQFVGKTIASVGDITARA
ncbi:MAG TPA: phage tail tape measure protein, partial [bacterium]|nr:phage tail tape measure protein [bacterium]